jgi:hypothetical protein
MEEEASKNPVGIPECLADMTRRLVTLETGRVDNAEAISKDLVGEVQSKAFRIIVFLKTVRSILEKPGYGQAGFIRQDKIQTSPGGIEDYSVIPAVTAKHNLRRVNEFHAVEAKIVLDKTIQASFRLPDLNWLPSESDVVNLRDGVASRPGFGLYGLDVSKGELVDTVQEGITSEKQSLRLFAKTTCLK